MTTAKTYTEHGHCVELRDCIGVHVITKQRVQHKQYEVWYAGKRVGILGWEQTRVCLFDEMSPIDDAQLRQAIATLLCVPRVTTTFPLPLPKEDEAEHTVPDYEDDDL